MADSLGLGRGTSSASFAGVEAGFETRSSSRLLWLQTKIVFMHFIFRIRRRRIINSGFWRCRACRQQQSFKATTSWLHATIPNLNQGCVDFTPDCSRHTQKRKKKNSSTLWLYLSFEGHHFYTSCLSTLLCSIFRAAYLRCQSGFCPPGEFHRAALASDQQRFGCKASLNLRLWKLIHSDTDP